jgi:hypothetical protein
MTKQKATKHRPQVKALAQKTKDLTGQEMKAVNGGV